MSTLTQNDHTVLFSTIRGVAKKLEDLTRHNVTLERGFSVLSSRAKSLEEMVVIEVMRESFEELSAKKELAAAQGAKNKTQGNRQLGNSRAARMPARALSR